MSPLLQFKRICFIFSRTSLCCMKCAFSCGWIEWLSELPLVTSSNAAFKSCQNDRIYKLSARVIITSGKQGLSIREWGQKQIVIDCNMMYFWMLMIQFSLYTWCKKLARKHSFGWFTKNQTFPISQHFPSFSVATQEW